MRNASPLEVNAVLTALERGDLSGASAKAGAIPGPVGGMLQAAVEHAEEPRELIEEVMFEKAL